MTAEQERLIVDNQRLVYKFLSTYHIYDEDIFQELMLNLCRCIDKYDPEKGAFSTWVYTVCNNKMHQLHVKSTRLQVIPKGMVASFNAPIGSSEDTKITTLGDTISDEASEHMLEAILAKDEWNRYFNAYKKRYSATWKRDMDIYINIILETKTQKELSEQYNITRQAINFQYHRIEDRLQELIQSIDEKNQQKVEHIKTISKKRAHLRNTQSTHRSGYVLLSKKSKNPVYVWIYSNLIPYTGKNTLTNIEIRDMIKKNISISLTTDEVTQALYHCGFSPIDIRSGIYRYQISENSPIILKQNSKEVSNVTSISN